MVVRLVHTSRGSSYPLAHAIHYSRPPRAQLRNRSCSNKQQLHDQVNHFSFFFFERGPFHAFLSRLRVVLPTQTSADKAQTIVILTSPVNPPRGAAAEQQHPVWRWLFASLSVSDFVGLNIHSTTTTTTHASSCTTDRKFFFRRGWIRGAIFHSGREFGHHFPAPHYQRSSSCPLHRTTNI